MVTFSIVVFAVYVIAILLVAFTDCYAEAYAVITMVALLIFVIGVGSFRSTKRGD